jgi:signal transduction histidine kinase/DNA-binding response OmpR family regulator/ligand-binding sensor domain-containing protein
MKNLFPFLSILLPFLLPAQIPNLFDTHPAIQPFEFLNEGKKAGGLMFRFQDSRGFIWGSDDKAHPIRFDGHQVEVFKNDPNDPYSASPGQVYPMASRYMEDSEGKVWIAYANGTYIDCFDPQTERFQQFRPRLVEAIQSDRMSTVGAIYEDHKGRIWIGAGGLLFRYDKSLDSLKTFNLPKRITLIFEDAGQNLWLHTQYQDLVRINTETGAVEERVSYPEELKPILDKNWVARYNDHHFELKSTRTHLLVVRGLLYEFDPGARKIHLLHRGPLSPDDLINYCWGKGDQILFTTQSGLLYQYLPAERRIAASSSFKAKGEGKKQDYSEPFAVFQTREGIIWANVFQPDGRWLNIHLIQPKLDLTSIPTPEELAALNPHVAGSDYCLALGGKVWFNTSPWLIPAFPQNGAYPKIDLSIPGISDPGALCHQFTTDRNGHLWQVTTLKWGKPLLVIREFGAQGTLVKVHASYGVREVSDPSWRVKQEGWSPGYPHDIQFDQNGKLWVGLGQGGLFCYNPGDSTFRDFFPAFKDKLPNVFSVCVDRENSVWCGGHFGLKKWDQRKEAWTDFSNLGISDGAKVQSITEDEKGRIWIGSDNGLFWIDPADGSIRRFGEEDYFFGENVTTVFIDRFKQLWALAHGVFYVYDETRDRFTSFGEKEGLPSIEVDNPNAYLVDKDGAFYFLWSANHIYRLNPHKIEPDLQLPSLHFTGFQLFSQKINPGAPNNILKKALDYTEHIRLQFAQNDFTLHYTAPEYAHPDKLEFFIRMEGFNDEWQNVGNKREARYTNLSPGKYTFQVKVRNHLGVESETPRSLAITILPPWYRTNLAYALWISLILGTIYAVYRYQLRRRLAIAEAAQLKELDQAKTQLYTNITHEFRTPLTVILGMAEQVKSDPKNWFNEGLRLIGRNGKHLLYLVNQLLDLSKLESGSMPLHLVHGDVISYLQYLTESFYSYADSKDIRLHFRTDISEKNMDHDPEKMQHILSNLLSNAIKFTPAGGDVYIECSVLSAQFSVEGEEALQVKVSDTGFGIAPEHLPHIFDRFYQADPSATRRGEGTGIGLALTKELVKVMGGEIEVESAVGKGTKFSIQLPVTHTAQAQPSPAPELSEALLATALVEEESPAAVQPVEPSDRYTVLLVEDNQDVITYLSSILSLYYRVETASNGKEGIAKALELTPDLIVSDVMMPDTDGFELCQTLKTDERTSHIPIILLTAKADQASKVEGLTYGADAYLTKPFHKEELLVRVEKLIEQRRKLQEKYQQAGSLRPLLQAPAAGIDDTFLQKVVRHIETHLSDEEYGMPQLCKAMNMSRSNLFRKLKALTGKSATDLIRTMRLEKAKELLETTEMSVSEVCYAVGFNNTSYFSTAFREAYGVAPSEMRGF